MNSIKIIQPRTADEFEHYYRLRWQILRQPWQQPKGSEQDELEASACHAMAVLAPDLPVGVARLHWHSKKLAQVRYMAVSHAYQRRGIGSALLHYLESQARKAGTNTIELNARKEYSRFYLQHGYHIIAAGPTLIGEIEHVRMQNRILPEQFAPQHK